MKKKSGGKKKRKRRGKKENKKLSTSFRNSELAEAAVAVYSFTSASGCVSIEKPAVKSEEGYSESLALVGKGGGK